MTVHAKDWNPFEFRQPPKRVFAVWYETDQSVGLLMTYAFERREDAVAMHLWGEYEMGIMCWVVG